MRKIIQWSPCFSKRQKGLCLKAGFQQGPKAGLRNRGFTLIELLVVIAIIGLLASIVLVSVNRARGKARDARRVSDLKQISTALEMFYDTYGRYPVTNGAPTWDGHWQEFADCLEKGIECWGSGSISGFSPDISKVPQDPKDNPATLDDSDPTYYTGWEGRTDQNYILRAYLETGTNHPALQNDADGGWRSSGDGGCNDPWYCIKQNWPW